MLFSIIYEADISMDGCVNSIMPRNRRLFKTTESSNGEPSDWCAELFGGECKHRKICGILTKPQFDEFLSDTGIYAERCETMGSIGAPGFDCGWAPAISFIGREEDSIQYAYVTPLACRPNGEPIRKQGATERDWQRIRTAILRKYS